MMKNRPGEKIKLASLDELLGHGSNLTAPTTRLHHSKFCINGRNY